MPDTFEIRIQHLERDMEGMKKSVNSLQVDMSSLTSTVRIVGGLIVSGITALIIMGLTP